MSIAKAGGQSEYMSRAGTSAMIEIEDESTQRRNCWSIRSDDLYGTSQAK